jgi:hypothetical protein
MTTDYTLPPDRLRELTGVEPDDMVTNEQTLPSSAPSTPAVTTNDEPDDLYSWTMQDLLENPPAPIRPLVAGNPSRPDRPGFVDAESVTMFYGDSKVGKSWLAFELGRSIASGSPFLGHFPVVNPGPVLYLDFEMAQAYWEYRWAQLEHCKPLGRRIPFHVVTRRNDRRLGFDPERLPLVLKKIRSLNPVLIVVDTIRAAFDGDENDSNDAEAFVNLCREIGTEATPPAAVVLLHHTTRDGTRFRGSGAFFAAVDAAFGLVRSTDGVVTLDHLGGRMPPPPTITYQLEPVGEEGMRMTYTGVPDRFAKTREDDQRVWEVIRDLEQAGTPATAANVAAVLFETPDPSESQTKAARRQLNRLAKGNRAEKVERQFTSDDGKPWKAFVYYPKTTGKPSPQIFAKGGR